RPERRSSHFGGVGSRALSLKQQRYIEQIKRGLAGEESLSRTFPAETLPGSPNLKLSTRQPSCECTFIDSFRDIGEGFVGAFIFFQTLAEDIGDFFFTQHLCIGLCRAISGDLVMFNSLCCPDECGIFDLWF